MKRKSLLFLMLMAMFAPLAMNGQQTLTVCDGGNTNSNVPIYSLYADYGCRSQFIIPADLLTQMNGGTIQNITFYNSSASINFNQGFTVYMKEVSNTTFSSAAHEDWSTMTVVKTGTLTVSDYQMSITLDTPYPYQGGNLMIGIQVTSWGTVCPSTTWQGEDQTDNTAVHSRANSSHEWQSVSTASFIPKTTFTYLTTDPYIGLNPASATVLTGSTQTLTATYGNVTNPTITYTSSNTSVATVSGSGTTATVTAVAPGTATITATMNGSYTATCAITVEDPSYCTPGTGGYDNNGISNVTFGTNGVVVNNTVGGINYGNYSNLVGAVEAGTTCQVDITYKTGYTYGTIIWVDWNHNYTFEGSEAVYAGTSGSANPTTLNATFPVPETAQTGDYRMRIIGADMALDSYVTSLSAAADADPCGSYNYSTCHDYTLRVTPASNCKKPTDLVATNVTKNSATLSWIENGEATAWNISVNGNVTPNVTNPYNLTGLTPETSYTVKVCPVCEDERWSDEITFTTLVACPAPTNVTANQVTNNSAMINWEGNASTYNVQYREYVPSTEILYDFEDGMGNWTTIDADGDGYNWVLGSAAEVYMYEGNLSGEGYNYSNDLIVSGSYRNISDEAGTPLTPDNYLVSPMINLGGTISFYAHGSNSDYVAEHFGVFVSMGSNNDPDDFVMVNEWTATTTSYIQYSADLSAYSGQGYVAIRHFNCTDQFLLSVDNITITEPAQGNWTVVEDVTSPTTITNLNAEATYQVKVQANCGSEDGTSEWVSTTFTTLDDCALPYELNATNLTGATATLNWTGAQEAYNVQYREVITEPVNLTYDFEDGTLQGWTSYDEDGDGNGWSNNSTAHGGSRGLMARYNSSAVPNNWLISPEIQLGGTLRFYAKRSSSGTGEQFQVYVSTTGTDISNFMSITEVIDATDDWVLYEYSLSNYSGNGYVAIKHTSGKNQWFLYVDDITITLSGEYGPWLTKTNVTSPLNINDLTPTIENGNHYLPINYEWQVQGINCDGNGTATDWSAPVTFTTPEGYFKHIKGYGTGTGNWDLIASPIGTIANNNLEEKVINIFSNSYDLFYFDQAKENEWVNYKPNESGTSTNPHFGLEKGKGYLYANSKDVDLVFTGSALTTTEETVQLAYTNTADGYVVDLPGWNLVGNPFIVNAYLADGRDFYTLTGNGSRFEVSTSNNINAMEGVFVIAQDENDNSITFTTTQPSNNGKSIVLNLGEGRENIDRAIVRFGEGRTLPKLQLFKGSTKIYIPQDGKEYAVVRSEEMGEMPVNFKAENNGTYSVNVSGQNTEFAYLHLIDNMTGADVDLLETPSYSFEAKTTDYESRFKLVFATGNNSNDDNFAFYSNGSFVINNEGNAELQVIDIMGRIVKSESINGCANVSVNGAAGVYMLRLVNGDNVKVQKVVVK